MKLQSSKIIIFVLIGVLFLSVSSVYAETIVLKSGKTVEGKLIEKTDKYIKIDFQGVPLAYPFDEIQSINGEPLSFTNSQPINVAIPYGKKDPQDIFKDISPAIVYISTKTTAGEESSGSGYIVDSSGVVVTNFHVVNAAKEINVKLKDGKIYPVDSIIYYNVNKDICILKIKAQNLPLVSLGDSNTSRVGEKVYVIGSPLGLEYTFSDGMVSAIRDLIGLKWLQITAPVSNGNSGGPVINAQGQVIGMVTFENKEGQNLNFALAINEVKPFISTSPKMTAKEFAESQTHADYYFYEGSKALLQKDYDQAISDYTKAIEINPTFAEVYYGLGVAYCNQGNLSQAISDYTKAIEINPNLAEAYDSRGDAYHNQGNLSQAISDYTKAIEINPNFAGAYFGRGNSYYKQGNLSQAISDYTKAIKVNPNLAQAYIGRGITYYKQDNFAQAISDETKAIEINPNDAEVYYNRGLIYDSLGNFTQAILDYTKAIKINPNYTDAYCGRGLAFKNQDNLSQAISDETKAIEINPNLGAAYGARGLAYYAAKDYDKTWADVHKAKELGFTIPSDFIKQLKQLSGRDK